MKRINLIPYDIDLYFFLDFKEYKNYCDKNDIETWENVKGITHNQQDGTVIVGVFDGSINTLVHELAHVAIYTFDYIGSKICEETEEPFAYFMGFLAEKLVKELNKNSLKVIKNN